MRGHFRRLGDDGVIDVADFPAFGMDQCDDVTQQRTAVGALELRVGIREMLADVAQRRGAEQGIAQGVQEDVTVRVGEQPEAVCNAHTAQSDEIAFSETVHIIAVANTHKKTPRFLSGRDSTCISQPEHARDAASAHR
ncbi:hypothetical protein D3C73_1338320 [compost metagenome]